MARAGSWSWRPENGSVPASARSKIGYNRVFGYYIEVRKGSLGGRQVRNLAMCANRHWLTRNAFITEELKEQEDTDPACPGGEDSVWRLSCLPTCSIRSRCICQSCTIWRRRWQPSMCCMRWLRLAVDHGYVRPQFHDGHRHRDRRRQTSDPRQHDEEKTLCVQ